jgi:hypothetical protein
VVADGGAAGVEEAVDPDTVGAFVVGCRAVDPDTVGAFVVDCRVVIVALGGFGVVLVVLFVVGRGAMVFLGFLVVLVVGGLLVVVFFPFFFSRLGSVFASSLDGSNLRTLPCEI